MTTVAVDLTPMLPGGGNGGAKWLTLAVLEGVIRQRPDWTFWFLTTAANEGFLGAQFSTARCLRVIDERGEIPVRPDLSRLPDGSRADLLYCPFTAPFHAHPAVPVVSVIHDLQFLVYAQFFSRAEIEERTRHFFEAVRVADRLVCVSDQVRAHVLSVTGAPPGRFRRIHNTLPDRLPAADPAGTPALMARLGLTAGRYLLYPANAWPHKNHAMLLTAAGLWFADRPDSDLKFVCTGVGDGAAGRLLVEAAERMGLAGRVLFPGFQSEADLDRLFANARALIFPSLFEGFGMPVLEAMARGLPVLSGNLTSLPEVAGDAALLFDPRRPVAIVGAIAALEDDPALAVRLAERGRQRAAELGDEATLAAAYLALFEEVLAAEAGWAGWSARRLKTGRYRAGQLRRRLAALPDRLLAGHHRLAGWRHRLASSRRLALARHHLARFRIGLRTAPARLYGQLQRLRAVLSRRLPGLWAVLRRLRRTLSGPSS